MNKNTAIYVLITLVIFLSSTVINRVHAQSLIVDASGHGQFKSIQAALNTVSDSANVDRVILIKKGTYHEKVFITQSHVVLQGEDEKNTIITMPIARDIWRCEGHSDDWGTATLNINGSDITLKNLTIVNSYGFDHKDTTIDCDDNGKHVAKPVSRTGHQMALRTFQTTRLKVINCILRALGGDTVSPWNTQSGMFYFKNCVMEGGVDFYCPRGWAYAEDCTFICHSNTAAIWHDGSGNKSQKTVLNNCSFSGDAGFKLGRYHKDAQFYLLNCRFAKNMADTPIYQAATSTGVQYGNRVYFYNCTHEGRNYSWLKNNLTEAPGAPQSSSINAFWAMDSQWNPTLNMN